MNIEISEKFKEELDLLIRENESYEDCIKRLIQGYEEDIKNIQRDKEAFTLTHESLDNDDEIETEYIAVTYKELAMSNVGDVFEPKRLNSTYFVHQKAVVVYKDEDSCLIKFFDEIFSKSKKFEEYEIIAYHFF
jgi:hypothetical protein